MNCPKEMRLRFFFGIIFSVYACAPTSHLTFIAKLSLPPPGVIVSPVTVVLTAADDLMGHARGDTLVYASASEGNLDIFIRQGTQKARRLTHHSTDDRDPVLSPDGQWVAWISQAEDVKGDLWIMDIKGERKRRFTDRDTADKTPCWSPDGNTVYFTTGLPADAHPRIDALDIDVENDKRRTVVEAGWDPALHPSGDRIYFVKVDEAKQTRIYQLNLITDVIQPVTIGETPEGMPKIGRVGTEMWMFFVRFIDDSNDNGVIDAQDRSSLWAKKIGKNISGDKSTHPIFPLSAGLNRELFPSPGEEYLMYTAENDGQLDILALPLTGMISALASDEDRFHSIEKTHNIHLKHMLLRDTIARQTANAPGALYRLGVNYAQRNAWASSKAAFLQLNTDYPNHALSALAEVEMHRLQVLSLLDGKLESPTSKIKSAVHKHLRDLRRDFRGELPKQVSQKVKALEGELLIALGHKREALAILRQLCEQANLLPEVGARCLTRMFEVYADLGFEHEVDKLIVQLAHAYPKQVFWVERARKRWLHAIREDVVNTSGQVLERKIDLVRGEPLLTASLLQEKARYLERHSHDKASLALWAKVLSMFPKNHPDYPRAMLSYGELSYRKGLTKQAYDLFERVIEDFDDESSVRYEAQARLSALRLADARQAERKAAKSLDEESRSGFMLEAWKHYRRLRHFGVAPAITHRRYIALGFAMGQGRDIVLEYEQWVQAESHDKYARYGYALALTYQVPLDLGQALDKMQAVLRRDPYLAAAHHSLGWLYEQKERLDPSGGWLEKAVDSYDMALSLFEDDVGLQMNGQKALSDLDHGFQAATWLNRGNALFALGKMDAALMSYIKRLELKSDFDNSITASLFYERLIRSAIAEEAYDVALDASERALSFAKSRRGSLETLRAIVWLQIALGEKYEGSRKHAYTKAYTGFTQGLTAKSTQDDTSRLVANTRGKVFALVGLGKFNEAVALLRQILEWFADPEFLGSVRDPRENGFVFEIAADPANRSRAANGFDQDQERGIAQKILSHLGYRWGHRHEAHHFLTQVADLMRQDFKTRPYHHRVELSHVLYQLGASHARLGQTQKALDLFDESLTMSAKEKRWADLDAILSQGLVIILEAKRLRPSDAFLMRWLKLGHVALKKSDNLAVAKNLQKSLNNLSSYLAWRQAKVNATLSDAKRFTKWMDIIENRVTMLGTVLQPFVEVGAAHNIAVTEQKVATNEPRALGEYPTEDNWRSIVSTWDLGVAPALAEQAKQKYQKLSELFWQSETLAFRWERMRALEILVPYLVEEKRFTQAWRLVEKERLIGLVGRPKKMKLSKALDPWMKKLALVDAGMPMAAQDVHRALGDDAVLIQRFVITPRLVVWTFWDPKRLDVRLAEIGKPMSFPAWIVKEIKSAMHDSPHTLYFDFGDSQADWFDSTKAAQDAWWSNIEVVEAISASHLALGYQARRNIYDSRVAMSFKDKGIEISTPDTKRKTFVYLDDDPWAHIKPRRSLLELDCRAHLDAGSSFLDEVPKVHCRQGDAGGWFSLEQWSNRRVDAHVALVSTASKSRDLRRRIALAMLRKGVPSVVTYESSLSTKVGGDDFVHRWGEGRVSEFIHRLPGYTMVGYRGTSFKQRVEMTVINYVPTLKKAAAAFNKARQLPKNKAYTFWEQAHQGFRALLNGLELLDRPRSKKALSTSKVKLGRMRASKVLPIFIPKQQILIQGNLIQSLLGLGREQEAAKEQQNKIALIKLQKKNALLPKAYVDLAKNQMRQKRWSDAAESLEACVQLAAGRKDFLQEADCASRMGSVRRNLSDFKSAKAAYLKSIGIYEGQNDKNEIYPRYYLAIMNEHMGEYDLAIHQFSKALEVATRYAVAKEIIRLQNGLARVHRARGDYQEALRWVNLSRQGAASLYQEKIGRHEAIEKELEDLNNRVQPKDKTLDDNAKREYTLTRTLSKLSLKLRMALRFQSESELEAAKIRWYEGDYSAAWALQLDSLRLAAKAKSIFLRIQALSLGGLIAFSEGRFDKAEFLTLDALNLAKSSGRPIEVAAQLNNLGNVLRDTGRHNESITLYREALAIDKKMQNQEGLAYDLRNLGQALGHIGKRSEAKKSIQEALRISRRLGNRFNTARCLLELGELFEGTKGNEAQTYFEKAIREAQKSWLWDILWQGLFGLGRVALSQSNLAQAAHYTELGLAIVEVMNGSGSTWETQGKKRALYEMAIELAVLQHRPKEAFLWIEKFKARGLADELSLARLPEGKSKVRRDIFEMRIKERNNLKKHWHKTVWSDSKMALGGASQSRRLSEDSVALSAGSRGVLMSVLSQNIVEAERWIPMLDDSTALVNYFMSPDEVWVAILKRSGVEVVRLGLSPDVLERDLDELRRKMQLFVDVEDILGELSASLLKPLGGVLDGVTQIVWIPDAALFGVPFAALKWKDKHIVEHAAMSISPSASLLFESLQKDAPPLPVRVVSFAPAEDLPFARLQATRISSTQALIHEEATESALKQLSTVDALDIAGHARVDAESSWHSSIELRADRGDDGRVFFNDIFSLQSLPERVSLSGCETSLGHRGNAGWLGLAGAFLGSGVRTILASQNRISDFAASVLVKEFYRYNRMMGSALALKKAMLTSRRYFAHPAYWSTFVIVGDFR
jgi:tetratricopeptide (TPR) repeat protein/CHAT domain-containing protein